MNSNRGDIFLNINKCLIPQDGNVCLRYYKSLAELAKYILKANTGLEQNIRICTSKNIPFVEAVMYMIGRPDSSWSICENGCVFYKPTTKEILVNPEITEEIIKLFAWIKKKIVPQILLQYPMLWFYPGNIVNISFMKKQWYTIDARILRKIIREKVRRYARKKLLRVILTTDGIDIIPCHINKGSAIEFLAKDEGVDLKCSLGIGGSMSDISFLNKMGMVGCPYNAVQICKDFIKGRRGHVSLKLYTEGVIDVLNFFTGKRK